MWSVQTWQRLVQSLGWLGLLRGVGAAAAIAALASGRGGSIGFLVGFIIALGMIAANWGSYARSSRTRAADEVVDGLVASRQEFCLLLRPFGSDGTALARHGRWGATWTLEQAIAEAARRVLGMPTFAIVDQDLSLAPPGPVYLRAGSTWQDIVAPMIVRAHTIFFVLAPGQTLRPALLWELDQIVAAGRQSRVIVLLPPPATGSAEYRREQRSTQRRSAALLVALLCRSRATATCSTSATMYFAVTSKDVDRAGRDIPSDTIVVQIRAYGPDHRARSWVLDPGRQSLRAPIQVSTSTYLEALQEPLAHNRSTLNRQSFEQRYRTERRADA